MSSSKTRAVDSRQMIPAALLVALLGLTFAGRPNWGVPPPPRVWSRLEIPQNRAFVAFIDLPPKVQSGGHVLISGWAAATSPSVRVVRVEVLVDGALAGTVIDFLPSPEIAASFGRQDFEMSAWQCVVSMQALKVGEHQVQLRLVSSDGTSEVAATKNLSIVE